jgi:prevent-host-death family protein
MAGETEAQFDINYAKKHLSCIVDRAQHGEEIIIAREGTPVAKVVPLLRTQGQVEKFDHGLGAAAVLAGGAAGV